MSLKQSARVCKTRHNEGACITIIDKLKEVCFLSYLSQAAIYGNGGVA